MYLCSTSSQIFPIAMNPFFYIDNDSYCYFCIIISLTKATRVTDGTVCFLKKRKRRFFWRKRKTPCLLPLNIAFFLQRKHFSSFVYLFKHFFSLNITFWVLTHETSGETRLLKSIHKVSQDLFFCRNLINFQKKTSLAEGFGGATRWDLMGTLAAHYFAPIGRIYQLWFDFCILILNLYSYSTL